MTLATLFTIGKYLGALVAGGGLWRLWDYLLQSRSQIHTESLDDTRVARELRDEMRAEMSALKERIDVLDTSLDAEREARLRAEFQNQLLLAKIDLLLRMVNELRIKEGLAPITEADVLPVTV